MGQRMSDGQAGVDISRWADILRMWSCWVGCHEAEIPPSRVLPFLQRVCHGPRLVGSNCALVYHILYFRPPCYSRALPTFHPHISLSLILHLLSSPCTISAGRLAMGSPLSPAQSVRVVTGLRYLLPVLILLVSIFPPISNVPLV